MNPYAALNRRAKAEAMADVLSGAGIPSDRARVLTTAEWQQVANLADVKEPHSADTCDQVIGMLESREQAKRKWSGRNPFERFTK